MNVFKIVYILQLISMLSGYSTQFKVPILNHNFSFIYFMFLTILLFNKRKKIIFDKQVIIITLGLIFIFCMYSVMFINEQFFYEICLNSIKTFIFIANIYLTYQYISINNIEEYFFVITYICISLFLIFHYIYNFDSFEGLLSIENVFNNQLRYRNSFGLSHANSTGLICFLALSFSKFIDKRMFNPINKLILNVIIIVILISTSSRNAITCTIIFFGSNVIVSNWIKMLKVSKSYFFRIACYISASIIIFIFIIVLINCIDLNYIINNSNRLLNFVINIPFLRSIHKEMFGLGFVNGDVLMPETSIYNITYVDNYYIYIFMMFGIVGLVLMMLLILYMFISIFIKKYSSLTKKNNIVILFITHLYCSIFERCFFEPYSLITYVLFILYFTILSDKNIHKMNNNSRREFIDD